MYTSCRCTYACRYTIRMHIYTNINVHVYVMSMIRTFCPLANPFVSLNGLYWQAQLGHLNFPPVSDTIQDAFVPTKPHLRHLKYSSIPFMIVDKYWATSSVSWNPFCACTTTRSQTKTRRHIHKDRKTHKQTNEHTQTNGQTRQRTVKEIQPEVKECAKVRRPASASARHIHQICDSSLSFDPPLHVLYVCMYVCICS